MDHLDNRLTKSDQSAIRDIAFESAQGLINCLDLIVARQKAEIERLTALLAEACESNKNLAIDNITLKAMIEEAFFEGGKKAAATRPEWENSAIRKRLMEEK